MKIDLHICGDEKEMNDIFKTLAGCNAQVSIIREPIRTWTDPAEEGGDFTTEVPVEAPVENLVQKECANIMVATSGETMEATSGETMAATSAADAVTPQVETPSPEPELDRKFIRGKLDALVTLGHIPEYKKGLGTPNLAKMLKEYEDSQNAPTTAAPAQSDQTVDAVATPVMTQEYPEASLDDFSNALAATVRKKAAELGGGEANFHLAIAWMRETYCSKREKKDVMPDEYAKIVADMKLYTGV